MTTTELINNKTQELRDLEEKAELIFSELIQLLSDYAESLAKRAEELENADN